VQERHSVRRSEADRYAAAVAYPLPVVAAAGVAQFESAERLQAAVLRRRAVAVPVPAHFSAEAVPAHFFAEAAALVPCSAQPKAQRSAAPEALAEQAVAPLPEESAARDAAPEPPRVAEHAGVAAGAAQEPRPEAAAWVAAAVPRLEAAAARGAAGVLQPGAAAVQVGVAEVVRQPGARDAAEVLRPAAPGVRVRAPARPSAGLSVFRRDPLHRRPAPSPAARFARAMATL
jgi:nicotinate-nucleotide--dimethylbenzimidazole phosphoribosyltransferase